MQQNIGMISLHLLGLDIDIMIRIIAEYHTILGK